MRFVAIAGAAVLALAPFTSAFAEDSSAEDLIKAVKRARLIDLSHTWDKNSPIATVNPSYSFALAATHANTLGTFGDATPQHPDGQLSFTSEVMHFSLQHGAPSIDAIGHIGRNGTLFGRVDAKAATSNPDGIGASGVGANLSIDFFPKDLLINRGILLDVASMVQGDLSPLPAKFPITAKHLADTAQVQGVRLKKGDTVFIRTGWGQHFKGDAKTYAGNDSPGPGLDGAEYLIRQGARVVGDDTLTFEQRPPLAFLKEDGKDIVQVFPVHMRLIADSGIYIIENLNLEELAQARAYEFAVVVPPLRIFGGSGSPVRIFALVPRDNE
jgi:kynurenine formamidase